VTIHAFDGRTDGRTDRQTEFSSLVRVCIPCGAVLKPTFCSVAKFAFEVCICVILVYVK